MAGAYEVLVQAIREAATSDCLDADGVPVGHRALWYEQVCRRFRPAEIVAVQEYLHADPRTWLLCDVSGLMYEPQVFGLVLARVKAECLAAGFDLDAESARGPIRGGEQAG